MKAMLCTRKEFLGASAAAAAVEPMSLLAKPVDKPLMRLGMISDTHLILNDNGLGLQNSLCFEPALRYFDERKADGVLVAGDLTDFGSAVELRRFAASWNRVFPGNRRSDGGPIKLLHIFGDHDMGGYMHKFSWAPKAELAEGIIPEMDVAALWDECFHEEWAPIQVKECCGFKFILAHHPRHTKESNHGDSIPGLEDFMAGQRLDPK